MQHDLCKVLSQRTAKIKGEVVAKLKFCFFGSADGLAAFLFQIRMAFLKLLEDPPSKDRDREPQKECEQFPFVLLEVKN